jgi:Fe-S oxidoreductase
VHHALDLCLGCKACKRECPLHVDMATYKAEFNAHYYKGRLRPRQAYALGWIWWWARAASHAPGLVNWLGRTGPFAKLAKGLAGVHPARTLPAFASRTFRSQYEAGVKGGGRGKVVFWPDTFSNHFHPEGAVSAVRVLERLGFEVVLPPAPLCCGRPLYDYGFLGMAKRLLARVLDAMEEGPLAGLPVVGVEPSCIATFRDELPNLFSKDERAERLARRTFLLGEFLDAHAADAHLGRLDSDALLHGHCHHKAVLDFAADQRVLARLGVRFKPLDSGCCGMAGPFGFETSHFDVAQACGERVLLPAVRARAPETLIVTEGFSCRTMIEQNVPDVVLTTLGELVWRGLQQAR